MQENKNIKINYFQRLKIFENENINKTCDELSQWVKEETGCELMIIGSVAKICAGEFSEDDQPKDIDFAVVRGAFSHLERYLTQMKNVEMIEHRPRRMILYSQEKICIEIWRIPSLDIEKEQKKYYKNLIPYLYGSKI